MKTQIVVTDLTRMQEQRVCVAGYDESGRCIRPVLPPPGIQECSLYVASQPVIFPFAVVEYDLVAHTPFPPHTEDHLFDPGAVRGCGVLEANQRRDFLRKTLFSNVAAIFEQPIRADAGFYLLDGSGPRSLGTIQAQWFVRPLFQIEVNGAIKSRLSFVDGAGAHYQLAVPDLAWRYYAEQLHGAEKLSAEGLAAHFEAILAGKEIYLRIGLARGWSQHPDRCYLQVTGVHTFPDYLGGHTFADFAPSVEEDDW